MKSEKQIARMWLKLWVASDVGKNLPPPCGWRLMPSSSEGGRTSLVRANLETQEALYINSDQLDFFLVVEYAELDFNKPFEGAGVWEFSTPEGAQAFWSILDILNAGKDSPYVSIDSFDLRTVTAKQDVPSCPYLRLQAKLIQWQCRLLEALNTFWYGRGLS